MMIHSKRKSSKIVILLGIRFTANKFGHNEVIAFKNISVADVIFKIFARNH